MAALLRILVSKINDSYRHTVTYRRLALPKNRANDCTPAPHPLHPAAWPKRHQPFPRGSRFFSCMRVAYPQKMVYLCRRKFGAASVTP